jgi:hypothetical protein
MKYSEDNLQLPLIMRIGKVSKAQQNLYSSDEKYDDFEEMLRPGEYWMGSNKTNTKCNKFTVFGADKTHADDTKEKST